MKKNSKEPCEFCGNTMNCCEHVCYECDEVVPEPGTCTNGRCETCCANYCIDEESCQ